MNWLQSIALILTSASAAASISESAARGQRRRQEQAMRKRGVILPKEAARELEHQLGGGRVAVGMDDSPSNPYKLVVIRTRNPGQRLPAYFLGYRVVRQPQIRIDQR